MTDRDMNEEPLDPEDVVEAIPEDVVAAEDAEKAAQAPKQLRDRLARSEAEVSRLQSEAMAQEYARLGLDPGRGIGRAAAQTYEGDASGLAEYVATEYEHFGAANPLAREITDQYSRLDAMSVGAGSVPAESPWDQRLAEAEARGDTATTMAMKGAEVQRLLRGPR